MNTATRARIRNFGSADTEANIAARVRRTYTPEAWAADAAKARSTRQEATVSQPNEGTIETLYALSASRTPWVRDSAIAQWLLDGATAEQVAAKIDWLETLPVATLGSNTEFKAPVQKTRTHEAGYVDNAEEAREEVPEGRYAVLGEDHVVRFYKVDRPTEGRWAGYVFVKVQASDELHNLRSRDARDDVLRRIAEAGIEASMTLYGRELGKCGHCGRTLTDEDSRARGIGPVCYGKMGF